MKFKQTPFSGLIEIELEPIVDQRGHFVRTFCKKEFEAIGFDQVFVQMNQSFNLLKGTFRGFHYQVPPFQESKLIRCVLGKVLDIVVDLRKNSDTFLQNYTIELSASDEKMILVPAGFAHGFLTLEDNSQLLYMHTNFFHKDADRSLRPDDPLLGIHLPFPISVISEKDKCAPLLALDYRGIPL